MTTTQSLITDVGIARRQYLDVILSITESEASWKPASDVWNVIEITEHLFWAEQGAIYGMWKTLQSIRDGIMQRNFDSVHKNLPIGKIIEQTWKPKEVVPAVAAPRLGGTLAFWRASLKSLQPILEEFGSVIKDEELRLQAHPHPISGALDFQQRIEFLTFHIHRHRDQVIGLMTKYNQQ